MATFELVNDKYLNTQSNFQFHNSRKHTHIHSEVTEVVVNWTEAEHCYVYSIKPGLYSTVIDTH